MPIFDADTLTKDDFAVDVDVEIKPEEEVDLNRIRKTAPPSRGLCRRCDQNKPINRMMLCYPCWVKTNLEKDGWKEGQPHPESCGCETGQGHSQQKSYGN
jgi:hypothetical protein